MSTLGEGSESCLVMDERKGQKICGSCITTTLPDKLRGLSSIFLETSSVAIMPQRLQNVPCEVHDWKKHDLDTF